MSESPTPEDAIEAAAENAAPSIRLDHFLKVVGLAETGGRAKSMIQDGLVKINGEPETRRRHAVRAADMLEIEGLGKHRVVVSDTGQFDAEAIN